MGMTKSPAVEIPADHLEEVDDLQERNGKKRTSVDQEEGEGSCIVCRFVLCHPWWWFLVSFFSFSFHLIFLLNPHLWLHSRFIFDVLTPLYLHNCHGSGQLWVWTCWASAALARCSSQTQWRRVARTRYRACGEATVRFFLLLALWLFCWTVVYNHGSVVFCYCLQPRLKQVTASKTVAFAACTGCWMERMKQLGILKAFQSQLSQKEQVVILNSTK